MSQSKNKKKVFSKVVKAYYDNDYVYQLNQILMDGQNDRVGIYKTERTSMKVAMEHTTERMLRLGPKLKKKSVVLDIGSGFGGTVRYISEKYGSKITSVDISEAQNDINQKLNKETELDNGISVTEANMELLPFPRETFDLIISQDSMLHSSRKKKVFLEVSRVLNPEGRFLFCDILAGPNATPENLEPLFDSFAVKDLSTEAKYNRIARKCDLEKVYHREMSDMVILHFQKLLKAAKKNKAELEEKTTKKFTKETINRYEIWLDAAEKEIITWGILQYQKRNSWA